MSPTATDQEILTGPQTTFSIDFESIEYALEPPLSDRLAPEHISSISFQHALAYPEIETKMLSKVSNTSEQPELDWHIKKDWEDTHKTDNSQTETPNSQVMIFINSTALR